MKVLITGLSGFAGSHLTEHLSGLPSIRVAGLDLYPPSANLVESLGGKAPEVRCCDLSDSRAVADALAAEQPDAVIHLAARAQVAGAWENAAAIMETNVVCTQRLLQAIHETAPAARVLLISSSEVYGKSAPDELPLTEKSPLRPNNPYSTSKVAQEFLGLQYYEAFGARVVIARPFNHIGPRQVGNFVVATFARQIAEMEAGVREPVLKVGNLEAERDFTDVRDIVRAYHLLIMEGEAGQAYNVCSGKSRKISEILSILLEYAKVDMRVEEDPGRMRPSDTPVVIGDASKLRGLGQWEPEIPVEKSLLDALDYWRTVITGEKAEGYGGVAND